MARLPLKEFGLTHNSMDLSPLALNSVPSDLSTLSSPGTFWKSRTSGDSVGMSPSDQRMLPS